ncbi:hypothetical protein M407DRAFT_25267 [Tulasnella calospora MUT 4182]|uniref:Uncharacterized protein n=1 Tax=Tulasnella calospora MUT 4182 TaxID=1051891 RepID=A0A0C3Q765_9AGAM|nr:hypothetical protein M407DRAFT_25267 [Tulasnella calospora MUT 4182]
MYSAEAQGTIRANSEYVSVDPDDEPLPRPVVVRFNPPVDTGTRLAAILAHDENDVAVEPRRSGRIRKATGPEQKLTKWQEASDRTSRAPKNRIRKPKSEKADNVRDRRTTPDTNADERPDEYPSAENKPIVEELGEPAGVSASAESDKQTEVETIPDLVEEVPHGEPLGVPRLPEPLPALISSGESIDIYERIRGKYKDDNFFAEVVTNPKQYRNFEVEGDLLYLKDGPLRLLSRERLLNTSENTYGGRV